MLRIATFTAAIAAAAFAAQAQTSAPLKIGVLMPTTGVFAVLGQAQIRGMQYAVDEAGGTVAGRKIELIIEDDAGVPATGLTKARKLVTSDNVDVMAGVISSAVALAIHPYVNQIKMPIVISNAITDELSGAKCSPFIFRVSQSSSQGGEPMGDYIARKAGVKRLYLMASDYVAPRESINAARRGFLKAGGTIVGESYPPFAKTQDYGPYISQARAANADAVLPVFYAAESILFLKQWQSFGLQNTLPIYNSGGLVSQVVHNALGDAALGVTMISNYISEIDTPANRAFVEAWRKRHNTVPDEFEVEGYDAIRFILEAVRALKGATADRDALAAAISKVSYDSPRGPISIDKTNTVAQNYYVVKTVKRGDKTGFEILETYPNVRDPVEGCTLKR